MSAKTTYQRSAKGPVSISECAADGRFIALENTGRKEEALSGWILKRQVDGSERCNLTMDSGFSVRAGGKVKLYARGQKPNNASANDKEMDIDSWGIGANITTKLVNPAGEDRATHVQKTIYTS